ncbi:MAG: hypothetical protein M3Y87_23790, partial [Myxococcota bacterium]|nr:hypothetical protein [Myxococcota bacterium]
MIASSPISSATGGTPFVGRACELSDLEALLARGERIVTITGLGGIGKSRLMAELVRRIAEGATRLGELDVLLCELGDAATNEALVDAV